MHNSSTAPKWGAVPGLAELQSMWQLAFGQGGNWIKGQPELIAAGETAMQEWVSHRRHGFNQAIEAWKQVSESNDLLQVAAIQQKLFAEIMQGFLADWMVLVNFQRLASQAHRHATELQPVAPPKTQDAAE